MSKPSSFSSSRCGNTHISASCVHFVLRCSSSHVPLLQHLWIYREGFWTTRKRFMNPSKISADFQNGQTTKHPIMAFTVSIDLFFCCGLLPWHPVKPSNTLAPRTFADLDTVSLPNRVQTLQYCRERPAANHEEGSSIWKEFVCMPTRVIVE